jgi:hypothetical protein
MLIGEQALPDSIQSAGTWVAAGHMSAIRAQCAAAQLLGGKIIVCGGFTGTAPSTITDLYDSGQWRTLRSMKHARNAHTATPLDSGRILVRGGFGAGGVRHNSAEVYDSFANQWSDAADMPSRFGFHHAIRLRSGKVLVLEGTTHAASLYDPASAQWARAAVPAEQSGFAAVLLPNGKVLICGGSNTTAQLYDPDSNTWRSTNSMGTARQIAAATLLSNGKVLVCGGRHAERYLTSAEIYDPLSGTWRASAGALSQARASASATQLPNGKILIAGGTAGADRIKSAELYDPLADRFIATGSMEFGRFQHPALLLPDASVLVADGQSGWILAERYIAHPPGSFRQTGSMVSSRSEHAACLLPDETVLVAGGAASRDAAEVFALGQWKSIRPMHHGRMSGHSATLLPISGRVLVAGGFSPPGPEFRALKEAEIFDPKEQKWIPTAPMSVGRGAHSAIELSNDRVLVAGGTSLVGGSWIKLKSAEIYGSATWSPAGEAPDTHVYAAVARLADGSILIAGGDPASSAVSLFDPGGGKWRSATPLKMGRKFATATTLADGRVLVAGGRNDSHDATAVAELYDPQKNQWTLTDKMQHRVDGHCATRLRDGRVLITGGQTNGQPSAHSQLYDPASETWFAGPRMSMDHSGHTTVAFRDGRVMVIGGISWGESAIAELYEP